MSQATFNLDGACPACHAPLHLRDLPLPAEVQPLLGIAESLAALVDAGPVTAQSVMGEWVELYWDHTTYRGDGETVTEQLADALAQAASSGESHRALAYTQRSSCRMRRDVS